MQAFALVIRNSRSKHTYQAYESGLKKFRELLEHSEKPVETAPISTIQESDFSEFVASLADYSPATEQLYIMAVKRFYSFLVAEELAPINIQRIQLILQTRARKSPPRLPQFPKDEIEQILAVANMGEIGPSGSDTEQLRALRDAAFLVVLADTGLRVHEACLLRRGDLDWNEQKAIIIGKGNTEAVVRFSKRAIMLLKRYMLARAELDGRSGKPLATLPLFARHDKGAGRKIKGIGTATGRNIVNAAVETVLGKAAVGRITPHSFRHYFVTNVLRGSGGNLKLAQELARHKSIQVTQRYAHLSNDELDHGYHEIFDT